MVDFVIPSSSSPTGCLEVTSTIKSDLRRFSALRNRLGPWATTAGAGLWFVRTAHNQATLLTSLRANLDELLAPLGQLNHDGCLFDSRYPTGAEHEVPLLAESIEAVFRLRRLRCPDGVVVQSTYKGGFCGADDVTDEVADALTRKDNLKKLRSLGPQSPGELFVWLVDSPGEAALVFDAAMRQSGNRDGSPGPAPGLPSGVARAWAAAGYEEVGHIARAVWYTEGGSWHACDATKLVEQ